MGVRLVAQAERWLATCRTLRHWLALDVLIDVVLRADHVLELELVQQLVLLTLANRAPGTDGGGVVEHPPARHALRVGEMLLATAISTPRQDACCAILHKRSVASHVLA